LKIRGRLVAGAIIALIGIAGCGASGSNRTVKSEATLAFNGPYGLGGPFEGLDAAGKALRGTARAGRSTVQVGVSPVQVGGSPVQVGGSTALEGVAGLRWLFALGPGVSASAPESVQPGTDSPADAAAGFYDAFYAKRFAAACDYVAPAQRANCPALLRQSGGSADSLDSPAVGFVVIKGSEALVTMTGLLCRSAAGCIAQHNAHWIFGDYRTFAQLWSLTASQGGNPLTVTPFTEVAGRWYLDLRPSAAAG
jgi:hypothetical protein